MPWHPQILTDQLTLSQPGRHIILRQFSTRNDARDTPSSKGGERQIDHQVALYVFFNSEFIFNYKKKFKVERVPAGN